MKDRVELLSADRYADLNKKQFDFVAAAERKIEYEEPHNTLSYELKSTEERKELRGEAPGDSDSNLASLA
jgi:hypothetical protein